MSGRSKILTYGLPIIGVVAFAGGLYLMSLSQPVTAKETPPRQPTTAPSVGAAVDMTGFIGATGVSEPAGQAITIAAHVSGVIDEVLVAAGEAVRRGDALFRLDLRQAESQVALKRSQIGVAAAEVDRLRALIPPREAMVRSARAAVASAEAAARAAQAQANNRQNLMRVAESVRDQRAIAAEEVDRRRFAFEQAQADVQTARARVEEANAKLAEAQADLGLLVDPDTEQDGADVRSAVRRLEEARQALAQAEVDRDLLTVTSPIDGVVLQIEARPGQFAPAAVMGSDPLAVLGRNDETHVRVEIDEVDIPRFTRDAKAWASPRGRADQRLSLELAYVEPLVVPKTNLAGRTSELIDTRVLQAVYRFAAPLETAGIGQLYDVFIETMNDPEASRETTDAS
ncbi:MAG: HlyD family efflux transporter periplasmic adaptor subunit [Planctomycetota bacterium]